MTAAESSGEWRSDRISRILENNPLVSKYWRGFAQFGIMEVDGEGESEELGLPPGNGDISFLDPGACLLQYQFYEFDEYRLESLNITIGSPPVIALRPERYTEDWMALEADGESGVYYGRDAVKQTLRRVGDLFKEAAGDDGGLYDSFGGDEPDGCYFKERFHLKGVGLSMGGKTSFIRGRVSLDIDVTHGLGISTPDWKEFVRDPIGGIKRIDLEGPNSGASLRIKFRY